MSHTLLSNSNVCMCVGGDGRSGNWAREVGAAGRLLIGSRAKNEKSSQSKSLAVLFSSM